MGTSLHINHYVSIESFMNQSLLTINNMGHIAVAFFGSIKSLNIRCTITRIAFQTAFLPWGDGTQFLPVGKKLLKAMQAQPGDVIEASLEEQL